jgi:rhodanese-related sulfurtransferase
MARTMTKRAILFGAMFGVVLAAGTAGLVWTASPALTPWTLDPTDPRVTLEDVEREVIRRYPVPEVASSTLAAMMARNQVALFDVRTQEEFDAGHLPGAVRIEPGSSASDILALHRDRLDDGPVVFYCAVGVRSSQVMMTTLRQIAPHASAGVYNLRGGVFRWTADGHSLVKGGEPGHAHPFDDNWGQLLARTAPR